MRFPPYNSLASVCQTGFASLLVLYLLFKVGLYQAPTTTEKGNSAGWETPLLPVFPTGKKEAALIENQKGVGSLEPAPFRLDD